jgi:hypothetical protein
MSPKGFCEQLGQKRSRMPCIPGEKRALQNTEPVFSGVNDLLQVVVYLFSNRIGVEIPYAPGALVYEGLPQRCIIIQPGDIFCKSLGIFVGAD